MLQLREDKKSPIYSRPMKQLFVFIFYHDCNMTSGQRQKVHILMRKTALMPIKCFVVTLLGRSISIRLNLNISVKKPNEFVLMNFDNIVQRYEVCMLYVWET